MSHRLIILGCKAKNCEQNENPAHVDIKFKLSTLQIREPLQCRQFEMVDAESASTVELTSDGDLPDEIAKTWALYYSIFLHDDMLLSTMRGSRYWKNFLLYKYSRP